MGLSLTRTGEDKPIITTNLRIDSPLSGGTVGNIQVIALNYDKGSLILDKNILNVECLSTIPGTSGHYATDIVATKDVDYTYADSIYTFSNNDIMIAIANVLVANPASGFRVMYNNSQTSIVGYQPTISGNTYTYHNTYSGRISDFVFTVNQDNSITIDTALSIRYGSSANTVTFFELPYTNGIVKSQIDAKFIPVDGSTITVDSNGKLAASGGGSSQLYVHNVCVSKSNMNVYAYSTIITSDSTPFTLATLCSYLYTNGLTGAYPNGAAKKAASGKYYDSTNNISYIVEGLSSPNENGVNINAANAQATSGSLVIPAEAIKDYVHAL